MTRFARATIVVAAIALIAVGLTYFGTGNLGFFWDDYFLLRPRPWSELFRVWHGSWDATGIVPAFYRPLAVWTDTAAFAVFGFNEHALRACALLELATGAWLIGEFVRRESTSTWLGAYAAALYAVHPAVSASAGPWWFEQNHRLSVICVGAALLAWQSRRQTLSWLGWWPVHAWILAGSLFKLLTGASRSARASSSVTAWRPRRHLTCSWPSPAIPRGISSSRSAPSWH